MTATIKYLPSAFDPTDITLTDDTSGALLIKEGSNEYMRIDTTNGSELNQLKVPFTTGEFKLMQETSAGSYPFIKTDATSITLFPKGGGLGFSFNGMVISQSGAEIKTSSSEITMASAIPVSGGGVRAYITQSGNAWTELLATGATSKIQRISDGLKMLEVDTDGNSTFTLADTSGATFTIKDDASPTPALHLRCTESANSAPLVEVNGLSVFPGKRLAMTSTTYGTNFAGSINQARLSISLGATSTTRNLNVGAVNMDAFAQILTATPSTTSQTFTLDFNNTSTSLSDLPIGLYKLVLKNAGTESCTFTAASTMASGGRVKGVDVSGASIGVIDSSSGSITAAAGETIYVEVTNHVSDSAGGLSNRFIICKTICKI